MSESPDFILHVVEFRAAAVNASLSLNGVELIRSEADRPLMTQIKINGWMRYSGNELILRAGAPEQPKSKRPLDLKVNLFRGPHGRQPEESEALRRYELQDPKTVAPGEPVEIWKASFPSVPYYGPWEWERAVELHVGDALTSAVAAALNSVAVALNERDTVTLLELFRVYVNELGRSLGIAPARIEAQLREWAQSWRAPGKQMIDSDQLSLTLQAENHVIRVRRLDHAPVLTSDAGNPATGPSEFFLAMLPGGGLRIVR
jgi:hypothetical protein